MNTDGKTATRPAPPALTQRQAQVLGLLLDGYREQGRSPTIREMMAPMGVSSTNAISDHLRYLRRKGYVVHAKGTSRGWTPVRDASGSPVSVTVVTDEAQELLGWMEEAAVSPEQAMAVLRGVVEQGEGEDVQEGKRHG